jgi:HK97 family phage major capsid protein
MTASVLPSGTNLSRYLIAKSMTDAVILQQTFAERHWPDSPAVGLVLRAQSNPMTTTGSGAPLKQYGITGELLTLLSNVSVVEKLKTRFVPAPFLANMPIENVLLSSDWVGETKGIPLAAASLSSVTLDVTKHSLFFVITRELLERGGPAAEASVRRIAVNSISYGLDSSFLDATIVGTQGVRPASITSNSSTVTSTGSTSAAIQTDLGSMSASLGTWRDVVWIMRQRTLSYIAATAPTLLDFSQTVPRLLGIPVFVSIASPAQIVLLDAGDLLLADDPDGTEIDTATNASLVFTTTPESSPASTELVSLFQRNYIAFRVQRTISWQRAHSSSVVRMAVAY